MKINLFSIVVLTLSTLIATPASAAVVISDLPSGTFAQTTENKTFGQNYLMRFTLSSATTLNGMDIYTQSGGSFSAIGKEAVVKIRSDVSGSPSGTNLFSISTSIASHLTVAGYANVIGAHSNFAPVNLAAGTYWIGMSGPSDLGLSSFITGGPIAPSDQRLLIGDTVLAGIPAIYNIPFQLYGDAIVAAVPEPTSWALVITGFGLAGIALRRRQQVTVPYA